MIDLNHTNPSDRINALIDLALETENQQREGRNYLGGSQLGNGCLRKLQYDFFNTPKDKELTGQNLRIFQIGHELEDLAIKWFRTAGFDLRSTKADGKQFGFSVAKGQIQGHIDGVFVCGPDFLQYPCLWECKTMKQEKFKEVKKKGLSTVYPIYAAQVAIYQAYMQLTDNPAIFTMINKNTAELEHKLIPFDQELAQQTSDNGVIVLKACAAGELLPRMTQDQNFYQCKFCDYYLRCWKD